GVDRAEVILLPGREDREIWAYFAGLAFPPEPVVRHTLDVLEAAGRPLSTGALEPLVDLSRARLEMMLKVLDVDGAVRRVKGGWTSTGVPWEYDRERYERVTAERRREQQAMLDYISATTCREEFLRRRLDDPAAAPCGRCDNCTGRHWPADVASESASRARDRLHRPGVDLQPRRMWPTGVKDDLGVSGRIDLQAETGRALGRLTDIGWGNRLRELFAGDDTDVPADLVDAVVKVLAAWDWSARPTGVVTIGSRSRPRLVTTLGHRIAEIGRLPYLGELAPVGDPFPRRHNSAQRLRSVWHALSVPADPAAALPANPGPVLLVDRRIEPGWTMTVGPRRRPRPRAAAPRHPGPDPPGRRPDRDGLDHDGGDPPPPPVRRRPGPPPDPRHPQLTPAQPHTRTETVATERVMAGPCAGWEVGRRSPRGLFKVPGRARLAGPAVGTGARAPPRARAGRALPVRARGPAHGPASGPGAAAEKGRGEREVSAAPAAGTAGARQGAPPSWPGGDGGGEWLAGE